jgi:hypothetical protein
MSISFEVSDSLFEAWSKISSSHTKEKLAEKIQDMILTDIEKSENKPKSKKKKEKEPRILLSEEEIKDWYVKRSLYLSQTDSILQSFKKYGISGSEAIKQIKESTQNFILETEGVFSQNNLVIGAFKILEAQEIGAMQSLSDGKPWNKSQLGFYDVSQKVKEILQAWSDRESLNTLLVMLRIGSPSYKTATEYGQAIVKQISIRSYTR